MKINRSLVVSSILLAVILILPCSGAIGLCNGVRYDKDVYRCELGELIGKCKGKDYYVAYDQCVNGIVVNSIASNSNSGTFTDNRDGKIYKWVKIGKQIWMAENLNYNVSDSKCYDNNIANCQKYGKLYNWTTAKVVCPKGWHLPTKAEWDVLTTTVGSKTGTYLKAKYDYNCPFNGIDAYDFSGLPGGYGYSGGVFLKVGDDGNWWSSSVYNGSDAYYLNVTCYSDYAKLFNCDKNILFSVRCLQDY